MRILLVTHYFPSHGGGIEAVALQLARQISRMGHQIVWFASDVDPAPSAIDGVECQSVPASNIIEQVLHAPYPIWSPSCLPALWRSVGRVDVVHVHEYVYVGSLAAMLIALLRRKPVVLTQHTGAITFASRLLTGIYAAANRSIGRLAVSVVKETVFVSDNVRRYFGALCSFTRPPRLLYNGLESTWRPVASYDERVRCRLATGVCDTRPVILFVGRLVVKKGLDVVRCLVPRFPDATWLFVGTGPVQPESWGLENVRALGQLDHEQLATAYRAADLLLLPSLTEGFPLVVQEALACGTAVLSTDEVAMACPEATTMIRSAPVPTLPEHLEAWTDALRAALSDREFICDREARSIRARSLWSWPACANEYVAIYQAATSHLSTA